MPAALANNFFQAPVDGYPTTCKKIVDTLEEACPLSETTPSISSSLDDRSIAELVCYLEQWIKEFDHLDETTQHRVESATSMSVTDLRESVKTLQNPAIQIALNLQKLITTDQPEVAKKTQQLIEALTNENTENRIKTIIKLFSELLFLVTDQYKKWVEQQFSYFVNQVLKEEKEKYRVLINKAFAAPLYKKLVKTMDESDWDAKLKKKCRALLEKFKQATTLENYFDVFTKIKTLPTTAQEAINKQTEEFSEWMSGHNTAGLNYLPSESDDDYQHHAACYHLTIIQRKLRDHHTALSREKKALTFSARNFVDRFVFNFFSTADVHDQYELVNTLLKEANGALQEANEDIQKSRLLTLISEMKTATVQGKQKMSVGELLSDGLLDDLEQLLTDAGRSFQHSIDVQKNLDDLLKKNANTLFDVYKKERLNKPLLINNRLSFRSWRLRIFDRFFPGGKLANAKKHLKPHDGLAHRQNSADRLMKHLEKCTDSDSYLNYVGLCCYELSQIHSKHSTLRKIIINLLDQIIHKKILTQSSLEDQKFIYRMLIASLGKHPHTTAKQLLDTVKENLLVNGVPQKILTEIETQTQPGVDLIKHYNQSIEKNEAETAPDEHVCKTPSLSRFHNTIAAALESRLLAYKLVPSGMFKQTPGSYSDIGSSLTSAISHVASATGIPFLTSANNCITYAFSNIDKDQAAEAYRNINKLFDTPEKCAQFSRFMAKTLTQIWEYQIEKVGPDNAKILAQAAVERMINCLMAGYFVEGVPIETQLIAAVRTQRMGHGLANMRITNDECATALSRKAWLTHEVFEKTPIYDANEKTFYYSDSFDHNFGAARDGAAVAKLLNIVKADAPVENTAYTHYPYKTKVPENRHLLDTLKTAPDKILAKVKKLKNIVREQATQLQKNAATMTKQNEKINAQSQQIDSLSQQMAELQGSFKHALENQAKLQQELQTLQTHLAPQHTQPSMVSVSA
jgi:hypothetical protein